MEITTVGLDIAKRVFQLHGVDAAGKAVLRRKLQRSEVLAFFKALPPCLVGIEACGTAHYWARKIRELGHEVRLMPPSYVAPYVKRGKTDAADAAAICEAMTRPTMRFVPIKTAEQQAVLMLHRTRDLLVRQRTMLVNALRSHMAELGIIAPQGIARVADLMAVLLGENTTNRGQPPARHYSRCRADHGIGDRRHHYRPFSVPLRSAPCGLDRTGAQTAQQRRQTAPRRDFQTG